MYKLKPNTWLSHIRQLSGPPSDPPSAIHSDFRIVILPPLQSILTLPLTPLRSEIPPEWLNTGKIKTDQGAAVADFTELNLLKTLSNNVSHDSMWDTNNQWLKQIQSRSSWWVFNIMDKIPNISKYSGLVKEGKRFIFLFVRLPALK